MKDYSWCIETIAGHINFRANNNELMKDFIDYFDCAYKIETTNKIDPLFSFELIHDINSDPTKELTGEEKRVRIFGEGNKKDEKFLVYGAKRGKGKNIECFIPQSNPDIKIIINSKEITVIGKSVSRISRETRRFVRDQIIRKINERYGRLCLHGSSTSKEGKAILVMGNSGSGKTTTVIHLLAHQKHDFLSGDRVDISLNEQGGINLFGSLEPIHIDNRSLKKYEELANIPLFQFSTTGKDVEEGKSLVERRRLIESFNCKFIESSSLALILFPQVDNSMNSIEIKRVSYNEQIEKFMKNVFTLNDSFRPNWSQMYHNFKAKHIQNVEDIIDKINELEIPCLSIRGNFKDYTKFLEETSLSDMINWLE